MITFAIAGLSTKVILTVILVLLIICLFIKAIKKIFKIIFSIVGLAILGYLIYSVVKTYIPKDMIQVLLICRL